MGKSFTIKATPQNETGLVTTGPFKWTRNPIYFGALLIQAAWALMFLSGLTLALVACLAVVLYIKILIEEENLMQMYADVWRFLQSL